VWQALSVSTADAENPLWSERHGGSLTLTAEGFATLLVDAFGSLKAEGLFLEVLALDPDGYPDLDPARSFFSMKLGDPWAADAMRSKVPLEYADDDRVFDLIELLHRDVVSKPSDAGGGPFDRISGQAIFRNRINPILARHDPPLELTESGHIIQRVQEPFRRLVEQPLPDDAPQREVTERVADAVAHFRRRNATAGDRRAAVRELADVLEFLRADVKEHMLKEDERALFRLANEFAIRHNKRETRRDFDEPAWLAWAFYVYLASIRLTLELRRRSRGSDSA
jgi:hypothetical protein